MLIKNALVFCERGFERGDIAISGEFFGDVSVSSHRRAANAPSATSAPNAPNAAEPSDFGGTASEEIIDAEGCYAIPGLIDMHLHGCVGFDFSTATVEQMLIMAKYQAGNGVTAICPTTMTLPEATLARACARIAEAACAVTGSGSADELGEGTSRNAPGSARAEAGIGASAEAGANAAPAKRDTAYTGAASERGTANMGNAPGSAEAETGIGASAEAGANAAPARQDAAEMRAAADTGAVGAGDAAERGAVSIGTAATARAAADAGAASEACSALVGVNLEGPFISPEKLGAQNPAHVTPPDIAMFRRLQSAARGMIKVLDIAPETEGALDMISALRGSLTVSLAHTAASYALSKKAFARGASHVTHLYNAMQPFAHREPGLPGAAFDTPGVTAELICDGIHIHPATARAAFKLLGDERVIMVSDSMMATGLDDGIYELGGLPVLVSGKKATLLRGDSIAGSVTNLMECLRAAVKDMGVPLHSAVKYASANPARLLNIGSCGNGGNGSSACDAPYSCSAGGSGVRGDNNAVPVNSGDVNARGGSGVRGHSNARGGSGKLSVGGRGCISPGMIADLVLLDENLGIKHVILRGKRLAGATP
jgi:N-acetylglucosamine-6-phosphate deacetylase